jgi:hypothetical protein
MARLSLLRERRFDSIHRSAIVLLEQVTVHAQRCRGVGVADAAADCNLRRDQCRRVRVPQAVKQY